MKLLRPVLILSILLYACINSTNHPKNSKSDSVERIPAVCISTGTPLREEPRKEGKWISSLLLGEKMTYLSEMKADSANPQQEYYRVELSDGKIAWSRSYGILLNATPAAIIRATPVYKRPDMVTKTDKSFRIVEFVAVVNAKEDWVEVVGAEKRKTGWIKKESISTDPEEVAVATLAEKDLLDKTGVIQYAKLSAFLESLPNGNTLLARYLQDQMTTQVEGAIEQSIMDYEGQEEGEDIQVDE
jgi:hypothetical protein